MCCLACWSIGNIIADSTKMRTKFISFTILENLLKLEALDTYADTEFMMTQAWLIGRVAFLEILENPRKS